jgi:hypothetical protein
MKLISKTIETTGLVSHSKCLLLDESLPIAQDSRVRVILRNPRHLWESVIPMTSRMNIES